MDAFCSGIAAAAELTIHLVCLFFSGFGNLYHALNSNADFAERRNHALLATAKLGIPAIIATSLITYVVWHEIKTYRTRQTQQIVSQYADWLDTQIGPGGNFRQVDPGQRDAWGTPLHVTWTQHDFGESLFVTSAGPDKQTNTQDDITTTRLNPQAKAIAAKAGQMIIGELKQRLGGDDLD